MTTMGRDMMTARARGRPCAMVRARAMTGAMSGAMVSGWVTVRCDGATMTMMMMSGRAVWVMCGWGVCAVRDGCVR